MTHSFLLQSVVSNGSKILIWKQITTCAFCFNAFTCCFQWVKDTNLKANHNIGCRLLLRCRVVSNGSKILIWKQITTSLPAFEVINSCFQWVKDTNLKANHNIYKEVIFKIGVVSNGSKILIWKQITTAGTSYMYGYSCFQWVKDTNLKANHNWYITELLTEFVVSNGSKILIWKQITTALKHVLNTRSLFPMGQRY